MRARVAWLLTVALPCAMVTGCTGTDGDGVRPTPEQSSSVDASSPPTYDTREAASDNGSVEVRETGFTVLGETDHGDSFVIWAAVIENASLTDLLAYVSLELTWRTEAGETEEVFEGVAVENQRAYDVLPGRAAVVGGGMLVDAIVPSSLEVSVHSQQWYPMSALEAREISVGVDVTGYGIDVSDVAAGGRVRAWADYTSSYDSRPHEMGDEDLRLLLVMRDAAGDILGALPAADFGVWAPGQRRQHGSVVASRWLDEADAETSEAAITRVCCGWVGG